MKKLFLASGVALFASVCSLFGGGLLTNTNQSVHFLRNPARDASTEIDAAYTNPAGLVKLKDGWHLSITNQSAFQTRSITSTFVDPLNPSNVNTKKFKGTASAPIVPSVMGAYKWGDWTISGVIAVTGGGGKATFNRGLPSFESVAATAPAILSSLAGVTGLKADKYEVDQFMKGSAFIYGSQIGGTYKINNLISVYGGFRLNVVKNGYEGYMRGLKVNLGPAAGESAPTMVYAKEIFESAYGAAPEDTPEQQAQKAAIGILMNSSSEEGAVVDVSQTGWGISPIIGMHFSYKGLDIGVKYEFRTSLNIENKTKRDDTGLFKDGVNTPHDIPGLFTVGVAYRFSPLFKASVGYHKFFDSEADMDKDKQKHISGGVNEVLAGVEFQVSRAILLSAGGQITRQGVKDAYQTDMSFSLNSYSIGVGGAVNLTENIRLNIAYFWTDYSRWNKMPGGGVGISKDQFYRTNKVFGVGADFSF